VAAFTTCRLSHAVHNLVKRLQRRTGAVLKLPPLMAEPCSRGERPGVVDAGCTAVAKLSGAAEPCGAGPVLGCGGAVCASGRRGHDKTVLLGFRGDTVFLTPQGLGVSPLSLSIAIMQCFAGPERSKRHEATSPQYPGRQSRHKAAL